MCDLNLNGAVQVPAEGRSVTAFARPARSSLAFGLISALWLAIVIAGALLLNRHAATPGPRTDSPAQWPNSSSLHLSSSGATLLVFVHPHCPCARATFGQLAEIMARFQNRLAAQVLFVVPEGDEPNWSENELWQTAAAIPGVRTVVDAGATEALRFGAQTSGHTLLFDDVGTRLFSGGITAARGHAGDNVGQESIVSYLAGGRAEASHAPTFGCPLYMPPANLAAEEAP